MVIKLVVALEAQRRVDTNTVWDVIVWDVQEPYELVYSWAGSGGVQATPRNNGFFSARISEQNPFTSVLHGSGFAQGWHIAPLNQK
jgi:hypothetical protein